MFKRSLCVVGPAVLLAGAVALPASGYEMDTRWTRSTLDGVNNRLGDPMNLTWSIVPDGTTTFQDGQPSDLIAFFDGLYGSGGQTGSDYSTRPWFPIFEDSFGRLSDLSGLSFTYIPNDAGTPQSFYSTDGSLTAPRGDIRIAGTSIDGQDGSNTLAYNYYPNVGDMVIDTDNTRFYGNTTSDSIGSRNVIIHEVGHGLGIGHVVSNNANFLMEPSINTSFDGPQLDDILALHRGYGDVYEKSYDGDGNDSAGNATSLGTLGFGQVTSIGTDGGTTVVGANDTDFVSIDDNGDVDFFSFTVTGKSTIDVLLNPKGPTYNIAREGDTQSSFDTSSLSDLTLSLYGSDASSVLASVDAAGLGGSESIIDFELTEAGTYFVRIGGKNDDVQLYQLDLFAELIELILGDLNADGRVDQSDLDLVLSSFGRTVASGSLLDGDASGDGYVDANDLRIVLDNWSDPNNAAAITPEPGGFALMAGAMMLGLSRRRHRS